MALSRAPGPPEEVTTGSSTNYPFWPGGFDLPEMPSDVDISDAARQCIDELEDCSKHLTCPPGFDHGVVFSIAEEKQKHFEAPVESDIINLASLITSTKLIDDDLGIWKSNPTDEKEDSPQSDFIDHEAKSEQGLEFTNENLDDLVSTATTNSTVLKISKSGTTNQKGPSKLEWAEEIDISQPVIDFHQQVPQMAYTWPFELDTFQKQAVIRLERNESVFVAAHTSAGKTVVAEYAVALSQHHMTRTIYTSPIKALSNQKFRDFKDTFNDVGLVTGDIQINPSATCLIMTTEILRSMLYNGSDIIRDLEYVVFDEVHYINDSERGVVWEEVLILLPDHVNIIMLSATVPNTMEFADWVGRTKRKKIYVISTLKRPVPLEHYLYTGNSGKTRDERFLLQDANGRFVTDGHKKAEMAKKSRQSKGQQYGAKGVKDRVGPMQEKNILITLVDHLKKQDKMPVVLFTLSRNRCDQNASLLTSVDLTTTMEKSDIMHFINRCIQRLKGSDRKLPQVVQLIELLKRGIGIHHSGILPILKEVVELLFQKGWVKLLFATETFAMGINMPARTVVFDNIKKHDGTHFRTLLPAEYIQMAGRAGRRGLDSTGTVIILCKNEVYEIADLHGMMQGKPMQLESKFRLTYSMILNLLRVEQLRVEDMMKRSFSESVSYKKQASYKKRSLELQKEIEALPSNSGPFGEELSSFYNLASEFLRVKTSMWTLLLSHPAAVKSLSPGRVLVFNHDQKMNDIGILLSIDKSTVKTYTILVLGFECAEMSKNIVEESFIKFVSLASTEVGTVKTISNNLSLNHFTIEINDESLMEITSTCFKIDVEKIMNDIKKRQIPRFRDDPPANSTKNALQELKRYFEELSKQSDFTPNALNWITDFKIQDMDLIQNLQKLQSLRAQILSLPCCTLSDFITQFQPVYHKHKLDDELKHTEYLLSEGSLKFLPDYHQRVEVLQRLGYIDENKRVKLKGRVACEMGSQELMITEIVFDNLLTDRPASEIAALLSCTVFQQKNCSEPELTDSLQKGVDEIKKGANMIGNMQKECGMKETDYVDQFHFGLVQVVYEWARGMPFAQITQLTDVQEGVIVRTIQRLDETLRDVKDAARVIGDPILYQKMDEASTIIKRDIVFAASLYTQ